MNGTHPAMLTCLQVDGDTLAQLVRLSTEQGRPVAEILADAVAQYAPKWQSGPAAVRVAPEISEEPDPLYGPSVDAFIAASKYPLSNDRS